MESLPPVVKPKVSLLELCFRQATHRPSLWAVSEPGCQAGGQGPRALDPEWGVS